MSTGTQQHSLSVRLKRSPADIRRRFFSLETREDVADLLEIEDHRLVHILYRSASPSRYRTVQVPKRRGGERTISIPHPSLSILQSKLNVVLQLVYRRKVGVHGFVIGRSILTNALPHVGKKWILNIDLADFFPSINFGRVRGAFMANPYRVRAPAASVLARICCNQERDELPQGAPTSPVVSNMVAARLDGELRSLAAQYRCTYTRFADDITLSCVRDHFPADLARASGGWAGSAVELGAALREVIEANGFTVNDGKTRLQFRDCHQEVTGITVNAKPNLRRQFVREVRSMIHVLQKYGLSNAERVWLEHYAKPARRPGRNPSFARSLKGKLDYLQMIRGNDDPMYRKLRKRLHQVAPGLIGDIELMPVPAVDQDGTESLGQDWQYWWECYRDSIYLLEIAGEERIYQGSAFLIGPSQLATAAHNLGGEMRVSTPRSVSVSAIAEHPRQEVDLAVLEVAAHEGSLGRPLPIRSGMPQVGEPVAILSFPTVPMRQSRLAINPGYVESIAPNYSGEIEFLQLTVHHSGGMSGGAVIDKGGRLVGIVVEQTFEQTKSGVPGRPFCHASPAERLREMEVLSGQKETVAKPVNR